MSSPTKTLMMNGTIHVSEKRDGGGLSTNLIEDTPDTSPRSVTMADPLTQEQETVCCGCRPKSKMYRRLSKAFGRRGKNRKLNRSASKSQYYDASNDNAELWDRESNDSQFFFDAVSDPLGDDEYPIVFTNCLEPKPFVDMDHPETLLRPEDNRLLTVRRAESAPIEMSRDLSERRPSQRLLGIVRRNTLEHTASLKQPRVHVQIKGYPGSLDFAELAECVSMV